MKHAVFYSDFYSFTVFIDSQSALLAIPNFTPSHPVLIEIQEWLCKIAARRKSVAFCWCPGHVGVSGNEAADGAARRAAGQPLPSRRDSLLSDLLPIVASCVRRRFNAAWDTITTNTKLRCIKGSGDRWPAVTHRDRRFPRVLNRLRIGHTSLTHNFLFTLPRIPPRCTFCPAPLTVHHVLIICPALARLRRKWGLPTDLSRLLGASPPLDPLINFLKEAGLFYFI